MKKAIVKALAMTGAVAMFGAAVLPLASYAAGVTSTSDTTVEVNVNEECLIGAGTANTSGEALLSVSLSAALPAAIDSGAGGDSIDITCNVGWTLEESAENDRTTPTNGLAMENAGTPGQWDGAIGFAALTTPVAPLGATPAVGDLATWNGGTMGNFWAMAYTGTSTVTGARSWHGPATTPATIASGTATARSSIVQYFGATTDGSVAEGKYGATVTYTLSTI